MRVCIQAAQDAIKKEKLASTLSNKLESRPDKERLVSQNVLKVRSECVNVYT